MVAVVTLGFFKHAKVHLDVQGFNVYHKNRLIKPFWRVWNPAGSDGRGVIGVLEANFVEPAHDKQGFERTIVLSRLEAKLIAVQKSYWSSNCEAIGYAPRRRSKKSISPEKVATTIDENKSKFPEKVGTTIDEKKSKSPEKVATTVDENKSKSPEKVAMTIDENVSKVKSKINGNTPNYGAIEENLDVRNNYELIAVTSSRTVRTTQSVAEARNSNNFYPSGGKPQTQCESEQTVRNVKAKTEEIVGDGSVFPSKTDMVIKLTEENQCLREGMKNVQQKLLYEKVKNKSLQNQLQIMKENLEKMDEEQEVFVISFSEERSRRELEEENLRKIIKDASETIQELLKKVKLLECRNIMAARD